MNIPSVIRNSLNEAQHVLNQFIQAPQNIEIMNEAVDLIKDVFERRGRIFACGNGGSMCDAMHFAEEWTGRFRKDRQPLPAMALGDASHLTCVANDYGYEEVFARPILAFGHAGDLLVAISTSGNSVNVLRAAEAAKSREMKVLGMLGKDGGKIKPHCDLCLIAPGSTSDRIQEIHMMVLHILIESVERLMFPENYDEG
ncbi:D-sedoheptulose 7-phosphate isomerase [Candidatus Poribacteria bacterium]|nr:D-sedoheptulose 7-phosphate isomerase [Candidatus Poribacteria bacterium]